MCFDFHKNVSYKMFRRLTHYDALLGFGGNTHCLPIRVGRSRNLVGDKRAIVLSELYNQLFAYQCFQQILKVCVVD